MLRTLLCCAALVVFSLPARADQTVTPKETLIRLTVQPMAAPKPALRYLLLPELKEMSPGNPIPNYLKCLMDQDLTADQPVLGRAALRQADRAARLDKPDRQIKGPRRRRPEVPHRLPPDLRYPARLAGLRQQSGARSEVGPRQGTGTRGLTGAGSSATTSATCTPPSCTRWGWTTGLPDKTPLVAPFPKPLHRCRGGAKPVFLPLPEAERGRQEGFCRQVHKKRTDFDGGLDHKLTGVQEAHVINNVLA